MKKVLSIIFKYWHKQRKDVRVKRNVAGEVTGYSFKSIDYPSLLADTELVEAMKENEVTQALNINHGRKGDRFRSKEGKMLDVNADFFYVGIDSRVEFTAPTNLPAIGSTE